MKHLLLLAVASLGLAAYSDARPLPRSTSTTTTGIISHVMVDASGSVISFRMDYDGDGLVDTIVAVTCIPNTLAASLNAWASAKPKVPVTFFDQNGNKKVDCPTTPPPPAEQPYPDSLLGNV